MSKVAENYFGLKLDKRLQIFIENGLKFLKNTSTKYKVIVFDVDNKDLSVGMSCPPKEFLNDDILKIVQKLIEPDGIFILNLVCRDEKLRNDVLVKLKQVFLNISTYKLDEEINEVVFCTNQSETFNLNKWRNELEKSGKILYNLVKKKKIKNPFENISDFLNNIIVV